MKITNLILILVMSLQLSVLADGGGDKKDKGKYLQEMTTSLSLSAEQVEKIKEFWKNNKKDKGDFKEMKSIKGKIEEAFLANASDDVMLGLHNQLKALKAKHEDQRFKKMIAFKNILNDEQKKKFLEIKGKRKDHGKHKRDK